MSPEKIPPAPTKPHNTWGGPCGRGALTVPQALWKEREREREREREGERERGRERERERGRQRERERGRYRVPAEAEHWFRTAKLIIILKVISSRIEAAKAICSRQIGSQLLCGSHEVCATQPPALQRQSSREKFCSFRFAFQPAESQEHEVDLNASRQAQSP